MAEHNAPLHAACDRLLGNVATGEQRRVVEESAWKSSGTLKASAVLKNQSI